MNPIKINLNTKSMAQTIEVNQGDSGRIISCALDEDVSNYLVYAQIKLPSGSYVRTNCDVDGNVATFRLPLDATVVPNETLEANLLVKTDATTDYEDLLLWKQKVESGQTVVLIESTEETDVNAIDGEILSDASISSFMFYIHVNRIAVQPDDPYQETLEEMQQAIQDCNDQLGLMESATTAANNAASNANEKAGACETAKTECVNATSDCTEITETAEVYVPQAQQIVETWQDVDVSGVAVNGVQSTNSTFSGETSDCGVELKKIVGKTVQNGTPSPDSPVPIENVKIDNIYSFSGNMVDLDRLKSNANVSLTRLNDRTVKLVVDVVRDFPKCEYALNNEEIEFLKGKTIKIICDSLTGSSVSKLFQFVCISPSGKKYINSGQAVNYMQIPENATGLTIQFFVVNTADTDNVAVGDWATFEAPRIVLYDSDDQSWKPYGFSATETNLTLAEGDTYENGKVTRVRKQVTFDGSSDENWSMDQSGSVYRFFINFSDSLNSDGRSEVKCNRGMFNNNNNNNIGTIFIIKKICYYIPPQDITTVEAFKTWLSTNNLVVEYELETPTTEEFKIPTIPSYEPYTQISTNSVVDPTITFRPLPFTECLGRLQELYDWYLKVIAGQTSVLIDTEEGS
ncbi:hypothetical protein [uncultured Faecalicoccus sp.]|uniref:hypothetical protein n=1 Tax=uncultured Faecalicoccus sp. TaxID=1971760 RepID=UPI0026123F23|nr:hypothetical protein [uncultured Faecalicoccus sp.]